MSVKIKPMASDEAKWKWSSRSYVIERNAPRLVCRRIKHMRLLFSLSESGPCVCVRAFVYIQ